MPKQVFRQPAGCLRAAAGFFDSLRPDTGFPHSAFLVFYSVMLAPQQA